MKKRYRLLMILLVFLMINKVNADEIVHGDTKDEVINTGSIDNEGDILVKTNLIKLDDEGNYRVQYTINANDVIKEIDNEMNVALILDGSSDIGNNKWNDMINGVKDFSKKLLQYKSDINIGLFKFDKKISLLRRFDNKNLDKVRFGNINNGKNIEDAFNTVMQYYKDLSKQSLNYVILISNGNYSNEDILKISNKMKDKNIQIYTIHYDDINSNSDILKKIASDNCYNHANINELITVFDKINNNLFKKDAGYDFKIKGKISNAFDYVDGIEGVTFSDGDISYNNLNLIDDSLTFSYDFRMRQDIDTEWYPINKDMVIEYKDYNDIEKKIYLTEVPMVYFISDLYNYTINYYKNTVNDDNYLGKYMGMSNKNSYVELDDTLYIPDNYYYDGDGKVLIDEENKIINVVYEIKTVAPKTGDSNNNYAFFWIISLILLKRFMKLR